MVAPGGTDASSGRGRAGEHIERTPRWLLAAGLLAVLAYAAVELWLVGRAGFPLDDSWIHLQFARNLADGNGLSYNSGRLVTGSTAPLWTALLSLGMGLPGGGLLAAKLLGTALHLLGIALTYRLARELALARALATLAAAWTLSTSWLVWSALSGMEIPLFIALSLGGMVLAIRERRAESTESADRARPPLSLALFALGALARPEGALLLLLAVFDRLLRWRRRGPVLELVRPPWRALATGLALAAVVLIPTALVYAVIGGSPLPTTFGSKAGAVRRWWPDAQYAYLVLGILFRPLPLAVLAAGAGALALAPRLGTRRDGGLLPALWLLALPLVYSMLSPEGKHLLVGNFGRYFFPLLPVVAVLGALGLERAWAALADVRAGRAGRLPLRAVAVAAMLVPTLLTLTTGATRYAQNVANVQDGDVAMALWLRPRLDPRALLAVQDIGALKFLLPNPVLDLSGIVDPELQDHVRAAADPAAATFAFLDERRPDYLVVFPAWYPRIAGSAGFRELHRLAIADNATAAAAEIVLYATPWTRYPLAGSPDPQSPGDSR